MSEKPSLEELVQAKLGQTFWYEGQPKVFKTTAAVILEWAEANKRTMLISDWVSFDDLKQLLRDGENV